MRRRGKIIAMLFVLVSSYAQKMNAQNWVKKMNDPNATLKEVQNEFNTYWSNKEVKPGSGWKAFKRWEYLMQSRLDRNGKIVSTNYIHDQLKQYTAIKKGAPSVASNANWTVIGPKSATGLEGGLGRVQGFALDPANPNIYWAGAPSGGLWKSTDAGVTWVNKANGPLHSALGVSSIIIQPGNSNIMYAATGDADHGDTQSSGVIKSTDGGNTWTTTGLTFNPADYKKIFKIAFLPGNSNVIFAVSTDGIHKSTNAGVSWTVVKSLSPAYDIEFHPTLSSTMYATGDGKIWRSTDTGTNWTALSSGIPANNGRCLVAVSASVPDNVYFLSSEQDPTLGVYKSTNKGTSFTTLTNSINAGSQTWYDFAFDVSPVNQNNIYVGGVALLQSLDGGVNWNSTYGNIHADNHNIYAIGSDVFVCNDGGLYRSTDSGTNWTLLHQGMEITQFYRISTAPYEPNFIVAGSQDNGTSRLRNGTWKQINYGDGMDNAIARENSNVVWTSSQNGAIYKSSDGGDINSYVSAPNSESGAWVTPFELNPNNSDSVIAGWQNLYISSNAGNTWTMLTSPTNTNIAGMYDKIVLNWNNPSTIYATVSGNLIKTANSGTNWTILNNNVEAGLTFQRGVVIDPKNSNRIWVMPSGLNAGKKVYYSSNGGASFTNISGTLPDIPLLTMVYVPGSNDGIYIGSETGVFYKDASMSDWVPYNTGLPIVRIEDLEINLGAGKLRVGTYGRGVWESPLFEEAAAKPVADFDPSVKSACPGSTIPFKDYSYKATSWNWSFPGGTPSTSTSQNPVVTYNTSGSFSVSLTVSNANGSNTKTQIGMVNISGQVVNSFPYVQNFDNLVTGDVVNLGGWTNCTDDALDWMVHTGIAPVRTGPNAQLAGPLADHTSGTGKYLLFESPNGIESWANLYSPCFNLSSITNPAFEFYEHVYGVNNEGEIHLDILADGKWIQNVIPVEKLIGDIWVKKTIDLSAYANKTIRFRFRALSSISKFSAKDFALDDINLYSKPNAAPVANFIATKTTGMIGFTTKFYDQSTNIPTSYSWSFPGGNPATSTLANPDVTYNTAGSYQISLTSTNAYGSNTITKTAYINPYGQEYNISNQTSNQCHGRLFDSGGPTGSYSDNENLTFTIAPAGAQQVALDFYSWRLSPGDNVSFYDGTSVSAPLISTVGETWGNANPGSIRANSGAITIRFNSNASVTNDGFVIEWHAIGGTCSPSTTVQRPVANFTSPVTSGDAPFYPTLNDASLNNPVGWTWIMPGADNPRSYSKEPYPSYSTPGVYNVTLVVVNEGGRDTITKPAFFNVTEAPIETNIYTGTLTACKGTLYDDGGADANYAHNKTYTMTIKPNGATSVSMNFSQWGLEANYDFLKIYNGPTTSSPLLGNYSATNPGTVTANSGVMTLRFTSDGGVNGIGWKSTWTSIGGSCSPAVTPVTDFSASSTTVNVGASVTFTDLSTNTPTAWSWTFQGGTPSTSTVKNPVVTYSTAGTYSVTLTASNAAGSNTKSKTSYIVVNAVPAPVANFSVSTTTLTAGSSINFTDLSTNTPTAWNWVFQGGTPNSSTVRNPAITYSVAGTYSVSLTASNAGGSNTMNKVGYITVTAGAVVINMKNGTETACNGTLYDDGGSSANYGHSKTYTLVIQPTGATSISMNFSQWGLEANYDFLKIYNGATTSSPLIGNYSATSPGTVTANSGKMTLKFTSDTDVNGIGWKATWTSIGGSCSAAVTPVTDFSASTTTINVGGSVTFTDLSTNNPTSWNWVFQGGTPSTSTVKNPTVTYSTAGTYSVTLTASNATGSNTKSRTSYIVVNAVATPVADFSASSTTVTAGSSINFTDLSTNTPTAWNWIFQGGTPSTSTVKNPVITYATAGTYSVTLTASNASGSNTKSRTAYIVVNASGVIINMKTGTETACNGTLYDDGGASANYGHSKTYTLVIQPTGATSISMNFSQWGLEANYDFLKIYNGATTSSPLIGNYSATSPGTVTANSGKMTLRFTSDAAVNGIGWKANWIAIGGSCGSSPKISNSIQDAQIAEINADDIMLYPNPTEGKFMLIMNKKHEQILITDITGKIIYKQTVQALSMDIDLSEQSSGVYILQALCKDGVITKKIVVK